MTPDPEKNKETRIFPPDIADTLIQLVIVVAVTGLVLWVLR